MNKRHPNFKNEDGAWYLVHCFKCKLENYAVAVASGVCAWCGDNLNKKDGDKKNG